MLTGQGTTARTTTTAYDLGDLCSRAVVVSLFLMLAVRIARDTMMTGRVTGVLLLVSESLVVLLMLIRRPTTDVDRSTPARMITILSLAGPTLVRPLSTGANGTDMFTALASCVGLLVSITSMATLGRSFGLVPANRGIVASGPYRVVRHPVYLGYVITHVAFAVANPLVWNLCILGATDAALLVRSTYEERTLLRDPLYASYRGRVRWRLVPGVF